jgi:hypothetical protein
MLLPRLPRLPPGDFYLFTASNTIFGYSLLQLTKIEVITPNTLDFRLRVW